MDTSSDRDPIAESGGNYANHCSPLNEAAHAASAEIASAARYGVGEEGFAMKSLPGDKRTIEQGIKKTTQLDVNIGSQRSLGVDDHERSQGGRYFI